MALRACHSGDFELVKVVVWDERSIRRLDVRGLAKMAIRAFSGKVLLLILCSKEAKRVTDVGSADEKAEPSNGSARAQVEERK
jgi:hypothetical protein